tara:strand:- start:165 stop:389 length:225 start_codon:yes stop_codon:yes gene_type:complete
MAIGGDLSHNKCDNCDSFLVWNEFGDSRSDVSQLEEVCEECEKHRFICDNCGNGFKRDEVVVTDDSSLCKTLCN